MKVTITQLKEHLSQEFKKLVAEDVDRERRDKRGYGNEKEGADVSYGDLPEDVDRVRRHNDGYGDDLEEGVPAVDKKAVLAFLQAAAQDPKKAELVKSVLQKLQVKPEAVNVPDKRARLHAKPPRKDNPFPGAPNDGDPADDGIAGAEKEEDKLKKESVMFSLASLLKTEK